MSVITSLYSSSMIAVERFPLYLQLKKLQGGLIKPHVQLLIDGQNYVIKTLDCPNELIQVLKLRFEVFYQEAAPYHFGQPHEGVKDAATVLRSLGLVDGLRDISKVIDLGNLDFSLCKNGPLPSSIKNEKKNAMANELISNCIASENLKDSFLLNIGGDHGMALGTIHGILSHRPNTIVVWADAHGDINTPSSSQSGNFHGMPLSFLLGIPKKKKAL